MDGRLGVRRVARTVAALGLVVVCAGGAGAAGGPAAAPGDLAPGVPVVAHPGSGPVPVSAVAACDGTIEPALVFSAAEPRRGHVRGTMRAV